VTVSSRTSRLEKPLYCVLKAGQEQPILRLACKSSTKNLISSRLHTKTLITRLLLILRLTICLQTNRSLLLQKVQNLYTQTSHLLLKSQIKSQNQIREEPLTLVQ
jgi:hypothetical protein